MVSPKSYVLVRGRNALPYVLRCLQSILAQSYADFTILFVDDASDYTKQTRKKINSLLKGHVAVWRSERYFSVRNAYEMIHQYCHDPAGIVINVDADDWLAVDTAIAQIVNFYQQKKCLLSYGNCYVWKGEDLPRLPVATDLMPFCNVPYPAEVVRDRSYRDVPFVVDHPRTWNVAAFKKIPIDAFQRADGSWLELCEDQAIFLPLLEMFGDRCYCSSLPLAVYNQANQSADIKVNRLETLRDEIEIRRKPKYAPASL